MESNQKGGGRMKIKKKFIPKQKYGIGDQLVLETIKERDAINIKTLSKNNGEYPALRRKE